jgi:ferredoxin
MATKPLYRPKHALDLLQIPLLGRLLRWRYGRFVLQAPFFIAAALLIYDGFTGPQLASRNLATVAPWVHYRGIVVLAILLVGNLFCMGCPFTIPRTLAKKLSSSGRRWPKILRNKWLAIAGLFGIFFIYEWLDLWASPALTAWVIVAYFVASFVLEAFFTESAFCKYVCPLGTFNFVYATASPTQIGVKDADICTNCAGKECVNGSYAQQPVIRFDDIPVKSGDSTQTQRVEIQHTPQGTLGCGTLLYPPQLSSNLDCTLCLDCVRACPHDNIGLLTRTPGRELLHAGAWPKRWDVSLLAIMLAFMGITNAFGMVPPVYELQQALVDTFGFTSDFPVLLLIFGIGNLLLPVAVTLAAAWLTRLFSGTGRKYSLRDTVATFAPSFIPLGFGIWIAHYGFHFLIAPGSIIPVMQEFLGQTGEWARFAVPVDNALIGLIQVVALVGGFVWSMAIAQRSALRAYRRQGVLALMPWALVLLLLLLVSVQIFALPMEMRGTEFLFD